MSDQSRDEKIFDIEKEGKKYTLLRDFKEDQIDFKLMGENEQELIRFKTQEIYDKFYNYNSIKGLISVEEATFTKENDRAKMTIVVQNVGIEKQMNRIITLYYLFLFRLNSVTLHKNKSYFNVNKRTIFVPFVFLCLSSAYS